jgi:hypothetical protein
MKSGSKKTGGLFTKMISQTAQKRVFYVKRFFFVAIVPYNIVVDVAIIENHGLSFGVQPTIPPMPAV